ncbi:hypothetical protein BRADI_3g38404v3 [Brachypodium distachyon]|uniref:Uncharacterized protein n=1 Tax=Brachypodium distachyon TaxID=15368 RepID=A0A2K2D202_BRADI|nr:hypothetical protein BRADI_3g38404v3 [Brachypodium distachyon]
MPRAQRRWFAGADEANIQLFDLRQRKRTMRCAQHLRILHCDREREALERRRTLISRRRRWQEACERLAGWGAESGGAM